MKAFLITLLVAAVFVTAALFVQAHIHREIEEFQSDFELLGGFLRAEDWDGARRQCELTVQKWNVKREQWGLFIDHSTLDETENTIYELRGHVEANASEEHWMGDLSRLYAQLVQIDMKTRLSWGHLF